MLETLGQILYWTAGGCFVIAVLLRVSARIGMGWQAGRTPDRLEGPTWPTWPTTPRTRSPANVSVSRRLVGRHRRSHGRSDRRGPGNASGRARPCLR